MKRSGDWGFYLITIGWVLIIIAAGIAVGFLGWLLIS